MTEKKHPSIEAIAAIKGFNKDLTCRNCQFEIGKTYEIDGAASSTGDYGAAMASGFSGKVMGTEGNALFLVNRNSDGLTRHVWAGIAGQDGIKPNVWYTLNDNGKPEEAP